MRDAALFKKIYEQIEEYLFYPSELTDKGIEGLVRAQSLFFFRGCFPARGIGNRVQLEFSRVLVAHILKSAFSGGIGPWLSGRKGPAGRSLQLRI